MSEKTIDSDLEEVLKDLESDHHNVCNYRILQTKLESGVGAVNNITAPTAERILSVCMRDGVEDSECTIHILPIISKLVKKVKDGRCPPLTNLVSSALTVLEILKTTALKTLCFEIINSYPDETLINIGIYHSNEMFKLINYCHQNDTSESTPTELRIQAMNIVGKLLLKLPPNNRRTFVKEGINIWFSLFIPLVVEQSVSNTSDTVLNLLAALELLTVELAQFDYANNANWLVFLDKIRTPSRYPAKIKSLLLKGSEIWHRLWIVFIKLLKSDISKGIIISSIPINVLLPCIEIAFKLDSRNRCRAFLCWNTLIDYFSKETNEALLYKRIKLLMIPLTENNTKMKDTTLAKFETWWHLIISFQAKLDKFAALMLIPFLAFCFGKPEENILIPGKICDKTKVQCAQAFINIVGHTQCKGCVRLPKLNVQLLNTTVLINYRRDWIHSLGSAIRVCVEKDGEIDDKQIQCLFKSFIIAISKLPKNNIRQDLFKEVLLLLEGLIQDCNHQLMRAVVNIFIPTLFSSDDKIQLLLKSNDEQNAPIDKIVEVLIKLPLDNLGDRKTTLENIKLLTNWMVNDACKTSSNKLEWFVKRLSSDDLLLWTALADALSGRVYSACPPALASSVLHWPFHVMNDFVDKEDSTSAWFNLYKTISAKMQMELINEELIKALVTHGDNQASYVFVLNATFAVLEYKLQHKHEFDKVIKFILQLTSKMNEIQLKMSVPALSVVVADTLTALSKNINVTITQHMIQIIKNILKIYKRHDNENNFNKYIENIFNSLEFILNIPINKSRKKEASVTDTVIENGKESVRKDDKTNRKNSAPSQIYSKKLSRMRRKPKKFDDVSSKPDNSLQKVEKLGQISGNHDLNSIDKPVQNHDKIKEKLQKKICTVKLDKNLSTTKTNRFKEKVDRNRKISMDSKKKDFFNLSKNINALPTTMENNEMKNKPCPDSTLENDIQNKTKSRTERQLAINMGEGQMLSKVQSGKRSLENRISNCPLKRKRQSFIPDSNKFRDTPNSEDICKSQDFIESSLDSPVTSISAKSFKPLGNKEPVVVLEDLKYSTATDTQNSITKGNETDVIDLTEEMDSKPIDSNTVVVFSADKAYPLSITTEIESVEPDIQDTADADMKPVVPNIFLETNTTGEPFNDDQNTQITNIPESNPEPSKICESPDILREDAVLPDKQDQSGKEVSVNSTSRSSSLSLNESPQRRPGSSRAAQMLGLCVPDRLPTMMASETCTEPEEAKRNPSVNTSGRRGLSILSTGESDTSDDTEESENFLKFRRTLPTTDCRPSGKILKRNSNHDDGDKCTSLPAIKYFCSEYINKNIKRNSNHDDGDKCTSLPAIKKKCVRFHDPPVSSTICVTKYIEPEQNYATTCLEKQTCVRKSPRRLSNMSQFDSGLNKAVDSSQDETPVVEAMETSPTQTDSVVTSHSFVQTHESGNKPTADIITDCISERPDFIEKLCENIDETSKQKIVEGLPIEILIKILMNKVTNRDAQRIVLSILEDQLTVERFAAKNLMEFSCNLIRKISISISTEDSLYSKTA